MHALREEFDATELRKIFALSSSDPITYENVYYEWASDSFAYPCPCNNSWYARAYPRVKKDTCLIVHDAVTPLTTLLVSEIKMAAQTPPSKVSDALQGFL